MEKFRQINPKITEQFADLKRKLAEVTEDQWCARPPRLRAAPRVEPAAPRALSSRPAHARPELCCARARPRCARREAIPEIGDYTIKNKKRFQSFVPVPDTLLAKAAAEKTLVSAIDARGAPGGAGPEGIRGLRRRPARRAAMRRGSEIFAARERKLTDASFVRLVAPSPPHPGGLETPAGGATPMTDLTAVGEGRGTVLGLKLDRLSGAPFHRPFFRCRGGAHSPPRATPCAAAPRADLLFGRRLRRLDPRRSPPRPVPPDSVSGQTVVDPKGYLTDLKSMKIASDADISDIKKARLLLKSVIQTNPKHAPGWIAAARLEEVAVRAAPAQGHAPSPRPCSLVRRRAESPGRSCSVAWAHGGRRGNTPRFSPGQDCGGARPGAQGDGGVPAERGRVAGGGAPADARERKGAPAPLFASAALILCSPALWRK